MDKVPILQRVHIKLLFVVILIVSLATLSVGAFSIREIFYVLKQQSSADAQTLSLTIANQLEYYLQDKLSQITKIGQEIRMSSDFGSQRQKLAEHLSLLEGFQDIFLITPNGTTLIKGSLENMPNGNYLTETLKSAKEPIIREDIKKFNHGALVDLIVPMPGTILVGTINLDKSNYIAEIIRAVKMSKGRYLSLVNTVGNHKTFSAGDSQVLHQLSHELVKQIRLGNSGYAEINEDKYKFYISYAPVKSLKWGVVAHIPVDQIYGKIKDLVVYLIVIFLLITTLAIIISLSVAHNLTKPIQKVIEGAQEIAKGNYNQICFDTNCNDEVGILTQAMCKMVQEIALNYNGLTNKVNQLSVISEVTKVINSSVNLKDVLHSIIEMTRLVFDYHSCAIYLLDQQDRLKLTACNLKNPDQQIGEIPSWVFSHGEYLVINDLDSISWQNMLPFSKIIKSVAFIPLKQHGIIKGLMLVSHTQVDVFSKDDIEILMILGGQAAVAIENALLCEVELRNQAKIQQAEKFAVIGQLAAGTAHEIRNPLTAIRGFIQLLQSKYRGMEPESEYTELILKEIDRINYITKEFMKLAKPSQPQFGQHDLNQVLKEVALLLQSEGWLKDVEITLDFDPNLPLMNIDQDQLKQVFMNLGTNAIHALESKGILLIRTQYVAEETKARISFKDNGIGIAEDELAKIFDPFFTSRPDGTGLGLAVSYRLIKNHGGEIMVTSSLGKGTEFVVEIPVLCTVMKHCAKNEKNR